MIPAGVVVVVLAYVGGGGDGRVSCLGSDRWLVEMLPSLVSSKFQSIRFWEKRNSGFLPLVNWCSSPKWFGVLVLGCGKWLWLVANGVGCW